MTKTTEKKPIMTQDHLNVLNIIKSAEHKYISSIEILAKMPAENMTDRKLKQLISELVNDYRIPIGSSSKEGSKGYFYCVSDYDYHVAKRSLISRAEALTGRLDILEQCHEQMIIK